MFEVFYLDQSVRSPAYKGQIKGEVEDQLNNSDELLMGFSLLEFAGINSQKILKKIKASEIDRKKSVRDIILDIKSSLESNLKEALPKDYIIKKLNSQTKYHGKMAEAYLIKAVKSINDDKFYEGFISQLSWDRVSQRDWIKFFGKKRGQEFNQFLVHVIKDINPYILKMAKTHHSLKKSNKVLERINFGTDLQKETLKQSFKRMSQSNISYDKDLGDCELIHVAINGAEYSNGVKGKVHCYTKDNSEDIKNRIEVCEFFYRTLEVDKSYYFDRSHQGLISVLDENNKIKERIIVSDYGADKSYKTRAEFNKKKNQKNVYLDNNVINRFFNNREKHLNLFKKFNEQVLKLEIEDLQLTIHSMFEFFGIKSNHITKHFHIDLNKINNKIKKLMKDSYIGKKNYTIMVNTFASEFLDKIDSKRLEEFISKEMKKKKKIVKSYFKGTEELNFYEKIHFKYKKILKDIDLVKNTLFLERIVSCPFGSFLKLNKKSKEGILDWTYVDMYKLLCNNFSISHYKSVQTHILTHDAFEDLRQQAKDVQMKYGSDQMDSELIINSLIGQEDFQGIFKPVHCLTADKPEVIEGRVKIFMPFLDFIINKAKEANRKRNVPDIKVFRELVFGKINCIDYNLDKSEFKILKTIDAENLKKDLDKNNP